MKHKSEKRKGPMNIIIFGYGQVGVKLYRELKGSDIYNIISFADNSAYKQGNKVGSHKIMSVDELVLLKESVDFSTIIAIASDKWYEIGEVLEKYEIPIEGVYQGEKIFKYGRMSFEKLDLTKNIKLYAGDICHDKHRAEPFLYGLSISKADDKHIFHDITNPYPLPDNSIFSYQAEDVLEHIEYSKLKIVIDEIYRILKVGGLFRISLPDYYSPYLKEICMKNKNGDILFDPTGGGGYGKDGVLNGGHVWFPNYKKVEELLCSTKFSKYNFLCYYTENEKLVRKEIDLSKGYIARIPEVDDRNKPVYSIVIDCYK